MWKPWRNRQTRNIAIQALVLGFVFAILGHGAYNAAINLKNAGIAVGFDFLTEKAGYDINFSLLDYSPKSASHGRAWLVGATNTIFFAALTIFSTTLAGLFVAIARLSPNWLLSALSRAYVEYVRNIPVLLHIFIWYAVVLSLPTARQSIDLFDAIHISNRGVHVPGFSWNYGPEATLTLLTTLGGIFYCVHRLIKGSGINRPGGATVAAVVACGLLVLALGPPMSIDIPIKRGFGFEGGMVLTPEPLAMWIAVTVYFSAHCAEVVRGAIIAVPRAQAEAAMALGAKRRLVMIAVVIPQALRAMVPPMTSNYINILKAAALGGAIGFLDIMGTTGGGTLNITGQAVECIAIVMMTYMVLNLILAFVMGRINKAVRIEGG